MLNKIIAFSINNKFVIGLLTLALIIWGSWSATKLPIDALPDITNNQVQIITLCPSLAGQEVEQLVTYPIEQSISNLPDLEELRSISRFGLSVITVVFDDKVDIYFARQLINEKLKEAEENIPAGIGKPELAPLSTGLGEVYQYIIHPKKDAREKYSAMDLRTMQDWIVARQLYGTPGIAEVNSFGGELKQYEVAVNPDRLLAMGVSIPDIFEALEKNNENTGGAYIDKKPNAFFIRGIGLISSLDDVRNIVVKTNPNGIPILINDVAELRFGSAIRYGALTYNGEIDAVGGVVMMLKGANSAEVVRLIKDKLVTIQKSLPNDVVIEPYLDRTDLVNRAISTVEKNLLEGALIVIFVLVLFLGNFRAGLIVASAIPLSLLFALGMMNLFGVSANLMSLGAIDFGLIVDGAVIIVEGIFHRVSLTQLKANESRLSKTQMNETVLESAKKMMNPAAFGQMIILIVYLPILSLTGIEGKMFGPMAQTVSFAILGAFLLSVTYIPMAASLFMSRNVKHKVNISDRMMAAFQRIYAPLLDKAISAKNIVLGIAVTIFLVSVFIFSRMGSEFVPTLQEGDFAFHCILPQGTSLSQSLETSMQASRIIKSFDEVKMVVGKTGSAEVPTDPMPPEASDIIIILKNPDDWKRDITYESLADEILEKLEVIPGVFFEKSQPIQMRFNELMTGVRQDVAIKIFGENMDTLLHFANKVNGVIQSVDGITDPSVERVAGLPQIVIKYNRSQIAHYGLNIEDINHIVNTAFAGGKAGVVFENERKFDLVVRLDDAHRNQMDDVSNLFIPTNNGIQIPLSQVAEIKMELGPAQISREDGKRRIVIGFNVKDRDVSSVVGDIRGELNEKVRLPEGYYFTFGGTFENLQAASDRLLVAVPLALALIFMLLYFTFRSIRQALIIYTAIPMAAIGGVFALLLRDMPFSISAGVGFIALFGVAVLNGIVLISTYNQLEKDGQSNILSRIKDGSKLRLRPVLMTATVASLGFLPMALSTGAGAEVQKPLATVVIGGLITATLLTLFVLPLLYMMFSNKKKMKPGIISIALIVLGFSNSINGQVNAKPITLQEATEIALKNNLILQSKQLDVQAKYELKKHPFELPKTELNAQYGQYNTIHNDFAFQIAQEIPFPGYFKAKKNLNQAELTKSEWTEKSSQLSIKAEVESTWYSLIYLQNTINQLRALDSLYTEFSRAAGVRHKSGETTLLEKMTAETKRDQFKIALEKSVSEFAIALARLKNLMNTREDFNIDSSFHLISIHETQDLAEVKNHPELMSLYQEAELEARNNDVEKAEALPNFSIAYFNQSIIGPQDVNGTEVYFDGNKRFQGINVGIGIPLTYASQSARNKSSALEYKALLKEAGSGEMELKMELENALIQYRQNLKQYNYYLTNALPNADLMVKTAQTGYKSGDIGYSEFLDALKNAGEIKLNYLQAMNQLNQSAIQIKYLTNQ